MMLIPGIPFNPSPAPGFRPGTCNRTDAGGQSGSDREPETNNVGGIMNIDVKIAVKIYDSATKKIATIKRKYTNDNGYWIVTPEINFVRMDKARTLCDKLHERAIAKISALGFVLTRYGDVPAVFNGQYGRGRNEETMGVTILRGPRAGQNSIIYI